MAGYVQKTLTGDERIVHVGRFHWLHTITMLVCVCTVLLSPVALVMFIHRVTTELVVTTRRLVRKTGWIMRDATASRSPREFAPRILPAARRR